MFKKLRNRFLLLNMAVTSFVLLAAFGVVYATTYSSIRSENERKLENVPGFFMVRFTDVENRFPSRDGMAVSSIDGVFTQTVTADYAPSFTLTIDGGGNIISVNSIIDLPDAVYQKAAQIAQNRDSAENIRLADRLWMYRRFSQGSVQFYDEQTEYIQISFLDITDSQHTLHNLALTFLFVGVGMLAVIFIISYWFSGRSIRPISVSWEKQKRFVADASHELKTPLSTIMANCGALEANREDTIENQRDWLDAIKTGSDRMGKLINSLLSLAHAEGAGFQGEKRPFDMTELIDKAMQPLDSAAAAKGLQIIRSIDITGDIRGYEDLVGQVLTILCENAVKYADNGGTVEVMACRTRREIICTVRNTGEGIPQKDLPYVFDRFYRVDAVRTAETGYGLGLSIAKGIAEQIGGRLSVRSKDGLTEFVFGFEG